MIKALKFVFDVAYYIAMGFSIFLFAAAGYVLQSQTYAVKAAFFLSCVIAMAVWDNEQ